MAIDLEMDFDLQSGAYDRVSSGGMLDAGWHRAKVIGVEKDHKNDGLRIDFEVTAGVCDGAKTHLLLFDYENAPDEAKAKKALDRFQTIAVRLGLMSREDFAAGTAKVRWLQAIGTECAIECAMDKEKKFCNITYVGVYPLNHAKVPVELRMKDGPDFEADDAPASASAAAPVANGGGKKFAPASAANGGGKKPLNLDDL